MFTIGEDKKEAIRGDQLFIFHIRMFTIEAGPHFWGPVPPFYLSSPRGCAVFRGGGTFVVLVRAKKNIEFGGINCFIFHIRVYNVHN